MQTSRRFLGQQFNKMLRRNTFPPHTPVKSVNCKSYATLGVRNPDRLNAESQAIKNNEKIGKKDKQHPEIVREVFDKTDCKSKTCITHCSMVIETKSIGYTTHVSLKYHKVKYIQVINLTLLE
jgi:hypothetical protein